ncbi:MAG TPA: hypothetical protein VFK54_09355 [Candidatus Limnocylindrales bacterium]|nr:hypothetical protein [Candidatus Limnocylindrales bacterium]
MTTTLLGDRGRQVERMPWGSVLLGALVVAFVRPAAWPVALAGFLGRGGVLLLLLPVLVIPTPTGIANAVGGPVSSFLFGSPSPALLALLAVGMAATLALVVAGAVVAGWSERSGILQALRVAADEGFVPASHARLTGGGSLASLAGLRLLGLVPPLVALLLSAPTLYDAFYRELVLPDELRSPLALRVLRDVPGTVLTVAAAWLVADAATSLAIRRHVLEGRGVVASWAAGWLGLVRRPIRVVGTALATVALTIGLVGPALVAGSLAWLRARDLLREDRDALAIVVAVLLFVALWLGGLLLAGVAATFRGAAWTFEVVRVGDAGRPPEALAAEPSIER